MTKSAEKIICAALHLPPLPGSANAAKSSGRDAMQQTIDFALRNAEMAVSNGISALYIQDLGDHPVKKEIPPYIIGGMAVVGYALRQAFPELKLGLCFMGHGAKEPISVAKAIGADFVRLKVFVGAMLKAEGVLEGCAAEAQEYQTLLGAENVQLLVDVYDRTGVPLAPLPLSEVCKQAAVFGNADALILTGISYAETVDRIKEVRAADLGVPLLIGGGVNFGNVAEALQLADGIIVSSVLKGQDRFSADTFSKDWNADTIRSFMAAAGV